MLVEKLRPAGSAPPLNAKLMLPNPPLAVTGVNGAAAAFTVRIVEATACVVMSVTGLTVRLKVLDDVCATGVAWSVAVTVNVLR